MLLGKQGGGGEDHHLFAARHGGKGGAQRHLGLAETDVAAHEPIHGFARAHVGEHGVDGRLLVRRGLERESGAEGFVVALVEPEGEAGTGGALGVEREQLGGGVSRLFGGLAFGFFPLAGAEAVQLDVLGVGAEITRHEV